MRLLESGTDVTVIALWLARVTPPGTQPGRYRPPDLLLAFLERL
jgi:hypothetical protein